MQEIPAQLQEFIKQQKVFFVATAMADGHINLSPKGLDSLRVLDANTVVWLNLTGSGNETATHLQSNPRITLMFCAFEGPPMILRLYGTAQVYHPRDAAFAQYQPLFPDDAGARQFIKVNVELVQTSCGFGVPLLDFNQERTILTDWTARKGREGVEAYWREKNTISLDGHPTGILNQ